MKSFLASILVLAIGAMTVNGICRDCACMNTSPDLSCVNGVCIQPDNQVDGYCACEGNWEGPRCDRPRNQQGQVSDPCAENPCLNSGHCNAYGSSYTCTCTSSFTGLNCETPTTDSPCSSNPCTNPNKPKCTDLSAGYRCTAA